MKEADISDTPDQKNQPHFELGYQVIEVCRIQVPESKCALHDDTVAMTAGSICASGFWSPIIVREIKSGFELIAGAQRLAAVQHLGWTSIPCLIIVGDEIDADFIKLCEDLCRKKLTVLRRAGMVVDYYNHLVAKLAVSGQDVPKKKPGRPLGQLAKAVQAIPLFGSTAEARRKAISRYEKIARIEQKAKDAAIEAKLDDKQSALLKIAKADGVHAQLAVVAELAKRAKRTGRSKPPSIPKNPTSQGRIQSPPIQPASEEPNSHDHDADRDDGDPVIQNLEAYDEFLILWKQHLAGRWLKLPDPVRERFMKKLRKLSLSK